MIVKKLANICVAHEWDRVRSVFGRKVRPGFIFQAGEIRSVRMWRRIPFAVVLGLVVGCSSQTQTYSISLKNDLPRPITIALTKSGTPLEAQWAAPEDVVARRVTPEDATGIQIIKPGKTASVKNIGGHFDKGSEAVLRVYAGPMDFKEMLNTAPGPNRVDVLLAPGRNDLVAREGPNGLRVEPANPLQP